MILGPMASSTASMDACAPSVEESPLWLKIVIAPAPEGSFGEDSQKLQWKKKRGKGFIPNHELVKEIYEYFQKYPNVSIEYIRGHTNLLDQHSFGNNEADLLARLATDIKFKVKE